MDSVQRHELDDTTGQLIAARRHALARQRALLMLALVLPVVALLAIGSYLHERALRGAMVRLDRTARIAQEHALKLFETNQMLLERMLDLVYARPDAELLGEGEALHRRLAQMAGDLPQVQGLFVNGADGRMLASSRVYPPRRDIDYTDRDWYRAYLSGRTSSFVTPRIVSRATGEPAFDMSKRREIGGRFAGSVHVSLRPRYLTDFYAELAVSEPGLRMLVMRDDGAVIARWPEAPPPDTQAPLSAQRRLGAFPVVVVASADRAMVMAMWWQQVGLVAALLLPASLGLAWSVRSAMRRTRAEIGTLGRLGEETARRRRAELALLQSQKLEAIGRLTGGVAHDFNNLLAVVSSNVELMRRLPPAAPRDAQLAAIGRAVSSGIQLTRQLLAFARKQALVPERVRLQDRLPGLLDLLRPLLGSSVAVSIDVHPDTEAVTVDPSELELALINLAVNAGDAMHNRGNLHIAARPAALKDLPDGVQGHFVVVDVDDTGPGVDPAIAESAFEPFFTTKPLGKGTGLGLSQVRAFCHSAGGEARLLAAPGGGARVRLTLRAEPEPSPGASSHDDTPALEAVDLSVLLVEDNQEVAQANSQLLGAMGARVTCVAGAEAALEVLDTRGETIDVVLSDIEMPGGMDGIALAALVRRRARPVPVVLMSGYAQRLDEALRQQLEVLPKPCPPGVLAGALRRAARSRQAPSGTAAQNTLT